MLDDALLPQGLAPSRCLHHLPPGHVRELPTWSIVQRRLRSDDGRSHRPPNRALQPTGLS